MLPAAGTDMSRVHALSHGEVWNFQDSGRKAGQAQQRHFIRLISAGLTCF